MSDRQFFRKYIDIINEAPATAINPNDPNAAAFGKQINQTPTAGNRPGGIAFNQDAAAQPKTQVGSNSVQQNNPANINKQATAARDKLQQQMSSGKINTPAPQTVNPNQQYGGGYDPNKVQYASNTNPATPAANTTPPSASLDTAKTNAIGGNTQPNLASQYVSANQPQTSIQPTTASVGSKPPATEPSLASQYVSANQPQTVAEEDNDSDKDSDLLKSIIRLIKQ